MSTRTVAEPKVIGIVEVARQLNISRQQASRLIREGPIPGALRLGTGQLSASVSTAAAFWSSSGARCE